MAGRHELTDAQWQRIEDLFPKPGGRGRPWNDHRKYFNGMLWILRTGAPWRDLPRRYGQFTGVHGRFTRWRADGTFVRILNRLRDDLDAVGRIDWDLWCIDGSSVRATCSASGARKKGVQRMNPTTTRSVVREEA